MSHKIRPFYEAKYKMELAVEVTGKTPEAIRKMMSRKDLSLAEVIKFYLKKESKQ